MKTKQVKNTPFTLVENDKQEIRITVGNTLVSEKVFKEEKKALNYIFTKPWELLTNTFLQFAKFVYDNEKGKTMVEKSTK